MERFRWRTTKEETASLAGATTSGLRSRQEEQIVVSVEKPSIFSKDDRVIAVIGGSAANQTDFLLSLNMGFSPPSPIGRGTAKMTGRNNTVALGCPGLEDQGFHMSDILAVMAKWLTEVHQVEAQFYGFIVFISHMPSVGEKKLTRVLREMCGPSNYQDAIQFLIIDLKHRQRFYTPVNVTELWKAMAVAEAKIVRSQEITIKAIADQVLSRFADGFFHVLLFQKELQSLNSGNTTAGQFLQFCVLRDIYRHNQEHAEVLSGGDLELIAQANKRLETQRLRCDEETSRLNTDMSRFIHVLAFDRMQYENDIARLKAQLEAEQQKNQELANEKKTLELLSSALKTDLREKHERYRVLDNYSEALGGRFSQMKIEMGAKQEECRNLTEENEALHREKIQTESMHRKELEAIKNGNYDSRPMQYPGPPLPPRIPGLGRRIHEEILAGENRAK